MFVMQRVQWVYECPKRGKLAVLVMEEERHEEEKHIASISGN